MSDYVLRSLPMYLMVIAVSCQGLDNDGADTQFFKWRILGSNERPVVEIVETGPDSPDWVRRSLPLSVEDGVGVISLVCGPYDGSNAGEPIEAVTAAIKGRAETFESSPAHMSPGVVLGFLVVPDGRDRWRYEVRTYLVREGVARIRKSDTGVVRSLEFVVQTLKNE